jgi:hypothetical protein
MLYREIIAVCSEIQTKHINTLCGQNVGFVNVKPGGTYSNQKASTAELFWNMLLLQATTDGPNSVLNIFKYPQT